jgi:Domain of unknown function (DUF4834)
MNIFVLFILGYLLYRFIGGFLIPLFRTTRHMRQQFQNMNKQSGQDGRPPNQSSQGFGGQNSQQSTANGHRPTASGQRNTPNPGGSKIGEYIDFEEVK